MLFTELFSALLVAVVLSTILGIVLGWGQPLREGAWAGVTFSFLLLFLTAWAAGVWLRPIGERVGDSHWFPFIAVGVIMVLALAALIPSRTPRSPREAVQEARKEVALEALFRGTSWVLAVALLVAIVSHYLLH